MKVLILTDHLKHSDSNSFYLIANSLYEHKEVESVHVVSKGIEQNTNFFEGKSKEFVALKMKDFIEFESFKNQILESKVSSLDRKNFDSIFLRLPRPIHPDFFDFLEQNFDPNRIINKPSGITKTGSKSFLLELKDYCPPMKMVHSIEEIYQFKNQFPIVLKPLEEYGGKGLVRIDEDIVYIGNEEKIEFSAFAKRYAQNPITYLAMKFLRNVTKGDKRIVVADGKVLTSALRFPGEGSWLCNISQGGSSKIEAITEDEKNIIEAINPLLKKEGIFLYGLDTLEEDDGARVISELNTLSVGGIAPGAIATGQPLGDVLAKAFIKYIK